MCYSVCSSPQFPLVAWEFLGGVGVFGWRGGFKYPHILTLSMVRVWKRKVVTKAEIEQERKAIADQRLLFEMEIELQKEAIEFRDMYLKWLDETVTLDDILQRMMDNSICKKINVWRSARNPTTAGR